MKVSKRREYMRQYRANHPDQVAKDQFFVSEYRKKNPWYGSWSTAKSRCTNPNVNCYARYGGRGIRFLLTKEEVAQLWLRDQGVRMQKPCLDRIDNDGHYEYANCHFIERSANSTKGNYEARWRR